MADYYKSNAIYDALNTISHNFQWVSGNAWLLAYGNKSDQKAKVLVLAHGTSWKEQSDILNTLKYIAKKLNIPIYKIVFDDSANTSISEVAIATSLDHEGEMYFLTELKTIFKNAGLDIVDGHCDKYLNDRTSSAYHKWQRSSLGNKIIVSDIDLIRIDEKTNDPIEFIELKRSTFNVSTWRPYTDDFPNFNLIDTISQQTKIPLTIVYNRMIKDKKTKVILQDIYDPISIFAFSNNNYKAIQLNYVFDKFVSGDYLNNNNNNLPICQSCKKPFTPKFPNAPLCFDCWKKQN